MKREPPKKVPIEVAALASVSLGEWLEGIMRDLLPPELFERMSTSPDGPRKVNDWLRTNRYEIQRIFGKDGNPAKCRIIRHPGPEIINTWEFQP